MKRIIYLLVCCSFGILNAQNDFSIPPGTIQLNDSLFVDKSPVTNLMFIEYLTAKEVLQNNGYGTFSEFVKKTNVTGFPLEMTIIIPSRLLFEFYSNNKYLKRKGYGRESKFTYHPVLNVSKKQAAEYCEWRTEMVNHLWKNDERYVFNKNIVNKISYRLASKNELVHANTLFSNSNTKTEFKEDLLKVKQTKMATGFTIFPMKELTKSEDVFNQNPNYEFNGFRCICEIEK